MPAHDETAFIPVPPEEVFDYLDDPAHLPVIDPTILHAELDADGPTRVGSRIRGTSKILDQTFDWVVEVVEHDRPRKHVSKSVEGKIPFTVTYAFTPEGGGTRLHYRNEAPTGLGGVFGKATDEEVTEVGSRQVQSNLATLNRLLTAQHKEAHTPAS